MRYKLDGFQTIFYYVFNFHNCYLIIHPGIYDKYLWESPSNAMTKKFFSTLCFVWVCLCFTFSNSLRVLNCDTINYILCVPWGARIWSSPLKNRMGTRSPPCTNLWPQTQIKQINKQLAGNPPPLCSISKLLPKTIFKVIIVILHNWDIRRGKCL